MFILYAVVIGVLLAVLTGGRLDRLGDLRLRWAWLAVLGLVIQLVLFSDQVTAFIGDAGPPIYVASTLLVLAVVLRNVAVPGLAVVALGAASNMAAILANGGYMPVGAAALEAGERETSSVYSNSRYFEDPALEPLTDVFAMPTWMPVANVFSIGDVIIAVGIVVTILWAVHRRDTHAPVRGRTGTDGLYGERAPGS